MKILVAPNSFKDSLNTFKIAEAIAGGLRASPLKCEVKLLPLADGGDFTAEVMIHKMGGEWIKAENISDPLMRPISAGYGWISKEKIAMIEMAKASGIHLLKDHEKNPLETTTYGTGQLIEHALSKGAENILLGLGGSATVDGGAGLLQALGIRLLNKNNNEVKQGGGYLSEISKIDVTKLNKRVKTVNITVLCDVKNPLIGTKGAAEVFSPQKGADKTQVKLLTESLEHWSAILFQCTGKKVGEIYGTGAAGGTAAGMVALLNAELKNGAETILEWLEIENLMEWADLVITAEGAADLQTLDGKAPGAVARFAKKKQLPVIMLTGAVHDPEEKLNQYFDMILPIGSKPRELSEALANTADDLMRTSRQLGGLLYHFS